MDQDFMSDLPDAVSVEMLQEAAEKDRDYVRLRTAVREGQKPSGGELTPYMSVWAELGVVDNLVCREDRLVVPSAEMGKKAGNIRTWLVDIAHDGHHGADAMKRYLSRSIHQARAGGYLLLNLIKSFNHFYIQVYKALTHLGIWQSAWSVKGSNVVLSPHLLEGTQE